MTERRRWAIALLIGVLGFVPARPGAAACDVAGADATALGDTWSAMDASCACAGATDHRSYTRCAYDVVKQRHHDGLLPPGCRSVARHRASQSTCGRAGAAVCCRVTATRVRGRIVRAANLCKSTASTSACIADPTNVFDGCLPTGCVACGNGVVDPGEACEAPTPGCVGCQLGPCGNGIPDPGEECDPPGVGGCLAGCRLPRCGDGVVEGSEQCEPGGSPGCTDDCKTGTCDAPPSGETAVACVSGFSAVAVGAGPGGALVAWDSVRSLPAVNGRRLDAAGVPIEPVSFEVSQPISGGPFSQSGPEIGGDASGWYVGWYGSGPLPLYQLGGARVDATGAVTSRQVLAQATTFGQCSSGILPPIGVVAEQPDQVAALWGYFAGCFNSFYIYSHGGAHLTFSGGQLQGSSGFGLENVSFPQPAESSDRFGGFASGGGDTVATFMSAFADWSSGSPVIVDSGLFAWWVAPTAGRVKLSAAPSNPDYGPGAAWGSASFLVAWPQLSVGGTSDIRALRFTRADGPLDPDGGLVLATGTTVAGSPRVAFDGTSWLVVWLAQTAPGVQDVLGVAVRPDGTIVDAQPRLLAAGVAAQPSITPWSGGWLLGVVRGAGTGLASVNVAPIAD